MNYNAPYKGASALRVKLNRSILIAQHTYHHLYSQQLICLASPRILLVHLTVCSLFRLLAHQSNEIIFHSYQNGDGFLCTVFVEFKHAAVQKQHTTAEFQQGKNFGKRIFGILFFDHTANILSLNLKHKIMSCSVLICTAL